MRQNLVDILKLKALPWTYLGFKKLGSRALVVMILLDSFWFCLNDVFYIVFIDIFMWLNDSSNDVCDMSIIMIYGYTCMLYFYGK